MFLCPYISLFPSSPPPVSMSVLYVCFSTTQILLGSSFLLSHVISLHECTNQYSAEYSRGGDACQVTSFVSDSLQPYGLNTARLLCPLDSPGKNTGVGCHALHQGIFLTQGLNPHILCFLHWQVGSPACMSPGKPEYVYSVLQPLTPRLINSREVH